MKFGLGYDWKELKRFEKLDKKDRSIVFYLENEYYFIYFQSIVEKLTQKYDMKICYITSSKTDPMLTCKDKNILPFYIGDGIARSNFFINLKADILVMTMPDLDTFHIKRSKVYPVHYVYVFHSMVSTHMVYRKNAFDSFDTIFCVGHHHIEEIKATEKLYNLNHKNLVMYGYGLLDKLQKSRPVQNQELYTKDGRKKILVAASWGKNGLLETKGLELVKILLDADYHVTVRPHHMTVRKWPNIIKTIKNEFKDNLNFEMETDVSLFESIYSSYGLISDWSGIGFEYAFVCERPVIYVDVPRKNNNPDYNKIPCEPLESSIRNLIGKIIPSNKLESIPKIIESTYENIDLFKTKVQEVRNETVFNLGQSGINGAKEIVKILYEKKKLSKN